MRRLLKKIYINIFKKEKMAGRREGGAPAPSIGVPPGRSYLLHKKLKKINPSYEVSQE
jgi:hypothetical protein